jgi:hypothetical protein
MKRRRRAVTIVLVCALIVVMGLTYRRWPHFRKQSTRQKPVAEQTAPSSVPPFSTKEPQRYQATQVVTSSETIAGIAAAPTTKTVAIARDGEKRREEYQTETGESLVYLEKPDGRFVLMPAKKLYANLDLAARASDLGGPDDGAPESFESLLNETSGASRYENLGPESLNGRGTTKYRVTAGDAAKGTAVTTVTLIWIDDELRMPIRSEMRSTEGDRTTKVTMELRNFGPDVDPQLFVIPADYQKVDRLPQ